MSAWLRASRLMLGLGWEIGPGVFLGWVGVSVARSAGPFLFALGLKPLVDGIYTHQSTDAVGGAVLCAVSLLIVVALPSTSRWVFARVVERSIMAAQIRILRLTASAPRLDHFERPDFWDRLQLLKRSFADLLESIATVFVGPLVVLQLVATAVVLARLQPWLLLLPVLAVPAAWLSQRAEHERRRGEEAVAESRRTTEHLFTLASSAESAKEIRTYALQDELLRRHRDLSTGIHRTTESALFRSLGLTALGWVIFALAYVGGVLLTLRAAAAGRLTPGDVALVLTLAAATVAAASNLSGMAGLLVRAVTFSEHFHWLAEQAPAPAGAVAVGSNGVTAHPGCVSVPILPSLPRVSTSAGRSRAEVPPRLRTGLTLENVSFTYPGSDRHALQHVDLRLDAGSVVAVVGENGAGKTTLVKLLSRMYAPTAGRILLDDLDLEDLDIEAYRQRLAAGFQDFVHLELLVSEAVGVGDLTRMADTAAVRTALNRADASFADTMAAGLDTQLGKSWNGGVDLSGGEWQKLALARAMMRDDPLLVIFDEPTASLDPQTEHAIFERVAADARSGASRGRVTLLISHRFSTVRMADKIVVLDGGRVLEHGSHEALLANGNLYAELYTLQARSYA
ncbi:MAG TPA: ABC transporter ATP-binding protein [Actinopolymorphaceae bacterium]|nr:ABC transporter ATP-binding protein [Actinopolymorphaceae bacterium]